MFPADISFQLTPNEDRTGRIHTKSILGRDEEDSRSRPLLGRRTDLPQFLSGFINEPELGVEYPYMVDEASKRSRRHNTDSEEARLLSPSAFSRISETLGALNTVGNFLVNFTRGDTFHHGHLNNQNGHTQDVDSAHRVDHLEAESLDDERPMQMISSSAVPNAILTLTKTMLGQNVTKTIEPFIKRVGISDKHELTTSNQNVNTGSSPEKKRQKHQAENNNVENHISSTVAPGKPFQPSRLS